MNWEQIWTTIVNTVVSFATAFGFKLIAALLVLVIGLKLAKFITKKIKKSKGFHKLDVSVQSFLGNCLLAALDIVVIVSACLIVGIPAASFIAALGTAGVAIGLALQGSLSNFAGGLMILIFKPFKVGDFIDSNGVSGTVIDISIFYTVLRTGDNKHVTIPNGTLMNSTVTNASAEDTRRVDFTFSANYGCDVEKVKKILLDVAASEEKAFNDPAPFCRLTNHGESSLDFVLRVWCNSADYWDINFNIKEKVVKAFEENGIEIPFPQLDVHLDK